MALIARLVPLVVVLAILSHPATGAVTVAILTAVIDEFEAQLSTANITSTVTAGGRVIKVGTIAGKNAVVTMTGIGIQNAAMTTQLIIDRFQPKYILFSGIAGGIDPSLNIGDVVVPKAWANPQNQLFMRSIKNGDGTPTNLYGVVKGAVDFPDKFYVPENYALDTTPVTIPTSANVDKSATNDTLNTYSGGVASTGFSMPMEAEVLTVPNDTYQRPTPPTVFWFNIGPNILKAATTGLTNVKLLDSVTTNNVTNTLTNKPKALITERGISSYTFLDNAEYRQLMYDRFKPSCVEMEGAAVLHVCHSNKVECGIIRSLSDLAGGSAEANEAPIFFQLASANSAAVMQAVVAELS